MKSAFISSLVLDESNKLSAKEKKLITGGQQEPAFCLKDGDPCPESSGICCGGLCVPWASGVYDCP